MDKMESQIKKLTPDPVLPCFNGELLFWMEIVTGYPICFMYYCLSVVGTFGMYIRVEKLLKRY